MKFEKDQSNLLKALHSQGTCTVLPAKIDSDVTFVYKVIKAISHTHRNRTEKLKCLKPYGRFHICAERRTENVHDFDFIFSVSVAEFQQTRQVILMKSAHTQPHALYITYSTAALIRNAKNRL